MIEVPNLLTRESLVAAFGDPSVRWYERRLQERVKYGGKAYLNPLKTIYIWASQDRERRRGFYKPALPYSYGRKAKNHGGS